jgi:hypothetical protein
VLAAAEEILRQRDALVAWRDSGFESIGEIEGVSATQVDTGGAIQALDQATALAVGFLVQASFTAVTERRVVLDRNRTIIDLASELYLNVDDGTLDFLISTNDLNGDQIKELEQGQTILYYP